MPRVETAAYATERQKWQTKPQAVLRFHHVPTVELLIQTGSQTIRIGGGEEGIAQATWRKIRGGMGAGDYHFAQRFVLPTALSVNATFEVEVLLRRNIGAPTGNVVLEIRTETGSTPSTTVLGTQSVAVGAVPAGVAGNWVRFTFPATAKPNIPQNVHHWIVVSASYAVDALNCIEIARNESGAYPDGFEAVNTQAAPDTWTLETATDLLFRMWETVTSISGVLPGQFNFSRDFASGPITSPVRPILECIEDLGGNTQVAEPQNARSTIGNLTVSLVNRDGEIFKQCSSLPMRCAAMTATSPGPGDWLNINESNAAVAGLPAIGTFAVRTGGVIERIRYDLVEAANSRIRVVARGVDGTTPAVHNLDDLGANGEEIRQGQRVSLLLGYQGVAQSDFLLYQNWDVISRRFTGSSVVLTLADAQRHIRKTVFLKATPDLPYRARGHPVDLFLSFLTSTGTGSNGPYDIFPADAAMGLSTQYLDVASLEAIKTEYPGETWEFSITGPTEGKTFFEEQFCKALALYPYISQFGQLAVKKFKTAPPAGSVSLTVTETDDVIDFEGPVDGPVLNEAVVEFDFDLESRPKEFGKRIIYTLPSNIAVFGRKPPWTLRHFGLRTADGAENLLGRTLLDLARRYGTTTVPPVIKVRVPYRRHVLDIGDHVKLTHSKIPNPITGVRGVTDAVCEVQDVTPTFLTRGGGLVLTLLYVGGIPTLIGGWNGLPFDLSPTPPPPPDGLELVINGEGQGNSPFFWGRDITVRWNSVGPIDGQEALGGNAVGTGPTIEGYWIEVYSPNAAGALVLRRSALVKDTQATYPYELNAADHGGTPSRTITANFRTQLPGGTRSLQFSSITPQNVAPSMAGFTPKVTSIARSATADWKDWPQGTDLDFDRFELLYASSLDPDWVPGMTPNKSAGFVDKRTTSGFINDIPLGTILRGMIKPWDVFGPGTPSNVVEVTIALTPDTVAPAAPTGFALSTGTIFVDGHFEGWVEATWNRNTEADMKRYVIRFRQVGTTTWSSIFIPQPTSGATVTERQAAPMQLVVEVQILAEDLWGNQSAWVPTTPAQITVGLDPNPATPTGFALSTGTVFVDGAYIGFVIAAWNANTELDVVDYLIRFRELGSSNWEHYISPAEHLTVRWQPAPMTLTYEAQIAARDRQGHMSAFGPATPAQITVGNDPNPAAPTGLSLSTGSETTPAQDGTYLAWVQGTWTRNTELDVLHYIVQARLTGATDWGWSEVVPQTASGNPVLRVPSLPAGISFDVRVQAVDRQGHASAFSVPATIVSASFNTAPPAPTGLSATPGAKTAHLIWNRVLIPDLDHYEVHESDTSGFSISGNGEVGVGTCIAHTGGATFTRTFLATTVYPISKFYRVVAVRTSGTRSSASAESGTTITGYDIVAPAMPTGLSLTTGVGTTVAQDGSYDVWVEGTCTRNTEGDMLQYIFRGRRTGDTTWQEFPVIQPASGNPVHRVRGLLPNLGVEVQVAAEDGDGNRSAFTTTQSITTASFNTDPAQVTGLSAAAGATAVRLIWAPASIPDLNYYEIHESASSGFTPSGTTPGSGTCIAHTGGATYERIFPSPGTTFPITRYYKIIAVRVSGNRGAASDQASATVSGVDTPDINPGAVSDHATGNSSGNVTITSGAGLIDLTSATLAGVETGDFVLVTAVVRISMGTNAGNVSLNLVGGAGSWSGFCGAELNNAAAVVGSQITLTPTWIFTGLSGTVTYKVQGQWNGGGAAAPTARASIQVTKLSR